MSQPVDPDRDAASPPPWRFGVPALDGSASAFAEVDLTGHIRQFNAAFEALTGYPGEELVRMAVDDLTPGRWQSHGSHALSGIVETGQSARYEKEYARKDGSVVPVELAVDLVRDDCGRPAGFLGMITDISERRQTERALRESEDRFRRLFDEAPFGYHVIDAEGRIVSVNQAECAMLGYSRPEMLGRTIFDFVAEDAREEARRAVREKFAGTRELRPIERTYVARDGRRLVLAIEERIVLNEHGAPTGIRSTVQDVTERKATEAALLASEARYRGLTEGSHDAVVVADGDGRIVLFNPAAERTFGQSAAEVLGRPLSDLIPIELVAPTTGDACSGRTVELSAVRKGGEEFPIELSIGAVDLAGARQWIVSIRDQTERQRMRALLIRSEKLASIGLLSAGVAHEINNPLAFVANNLAVLARDLAGVMAMLDAYEGAADRIAGAAPEAAAAARALAEELDYEYVRSNIPRLIDRTRDGVQRVAAIVQNLRGLARTAPPKMELVSIVDLMEGALEMVRGRLRRGQIELEQAHEPTPKIPCVGAQIGQVALNLIINAIQAVEADSPEGGGRIWLASRIDGDHVTLEVVDNGAGISPDDLPKLFDPFYTTKAVGEGTGLGLSISHGIVAGHGGRIEVGPAPGGRGACFRVLIPTELQPQPQSRENRGGTA